MKSLWLTIAFLLPVLCFSQEETTKDKLILDYGGALRYNYNLSTWKPNQVKRGGDLGFEMFRINVDATYNKWGVHVDQRFYSADFGGAFLKYGWIQYDLDDKNHLKFGLIPAYFGTQQFNSHSWFFQLPFYLGFEDDHDMGLSYDYKDDHWQVDIGYYKNAEELSFSDNGPVSDARYGYDFSGQNKEVHQVNLRTNYTFGKDVKHVVGFSTQFGGIWNLDTQELGSQGAFGLHYELKHERWNIKSQYLGYNNQPNNAAGQSREWIEMTAYGFPYNTAAKASIYSLGLAYTLPVKLGPISSIQFYDNYSYMDKSVAEWEDTQMNVLGMLITAKPVYVYVDVASGKHQPWLGPQWTNALTTGDPGNSWETRLNINVGVYF